jgi:hypothetical protein
MLGIFCSRVSGLLSGVLCDREVVRLIERTNTPSGIFSYFSLYPITTDLPSREDTSIICTREVYMELSIGISELEICDHLIFAHYLALERETESMRTLE